MTLWVKYEGTTYADFKGKLDFEVHVKDPCIVLAQVTAPAQLDNPTDYYLCAP